MTRKFLLTCGIISSLQYIAMNVFIPLLYEGYCSASQTVSELSAIGAPTRTLWVCLGIVYTIFIIAFGWGILQSAGGNRPLRIVGILMLLHGVIDMVWPFAPMHQREIIATGGGTLTDTMHIIMSMITVLLMMLMIGFGAVAFGKMFRVYSIITQLILVAFGILTVIESPGISKNLPTPWIGIWERINIGVFMLWVLVLAIVTLHAEKKKSHKFI
jgi:O-antigen ligase